MSEVAAFIPLSVPHIRANEWTYVKECLDGEWVSSAGPFVDRFEKEFAAFVGTKHAIACSSGTAALHVSLLIAGVKPGDLVLAPTLTFISSVNCIRYCGADPIFFDCDDFYNLDVAQVEQFIRNECSFLEKALIHKKTGRRVAAVLPVHIFGNCAKLEPLIACAAEFGLPIVEDAAESLGSRYLAVSGRRSSGRHTGTLGMLGCFSFNGNKIITTGGGGMIVTEDDTLARRAKYLTTQAKDDEARFVHNEIGFNYRLTNVQAAIGSGQLEKLTEYKTRKSEIFLAYQVGLKGVAGLKLADPPPYGDNNLWMPCLQVDADVYGENWEALMNRLQVARIQVRPVWELSHRQKPYRSSIVMDVKNAERLHALTLNIPCSVGLTPEQQQRVIQELRRGS